MALMLEVSAGDFLDRLTILRLKAAHVHDPAVLDVLGAQLDAMERAFRSGIPVTPPVGELLEELAAVNGMLWDLETEVRRCMREGRRIDAIARKIFEMNETRADLKTALDREIDGASAAAKYFG